MSRTLLCRERAYGGLRLGIRDQQAAMSGHYRYLRRREVSMARVW